MTSPRTKDIEPEHASWQMTASYADYMIDEVIDANLPFMSAEELKRVFIEKLDTRKRRNG